MNQITSTQNQLVKRIRSLSSKKGRLDEGMFALEGRKLLEEAVEFGLELRFILTEPQFLAEHAALIEKAINAGAEVFSVDRVVLESAVDTRTPSGVVAAAALPINQAPKYYAAGLWVALDGLQDPGNLGTILRSADAMGASGILLGEGCVDPYSPKAIRAAMGSTFHLPIVETNNLEQEIGRIREQGFEIIATLLDGSEKLPDSLNEKTILIIGNEGNGIRNEVAEQATLRYRLTMKGRAESLNAAVCAGIVLYELSKRMD